MQLNLNVLTWNIRILALPEVSWYSAFLIKLFLKSIEFGEDLNFDLYDFIDFFIIFNIANSNVQIYLTTINYFAQETKHIWHQIGGYTVII
jgi:hypothetical protein